MMNPFHESEQAIHKRLGIKGIEDWAQKVIRDHMPQQHRDFFETLPFMILSARDEKGRPWATIIEGHDGFITSPTKKRLHFNATLKASDALYDQLRDDTDIGLLGIEPSTRRRNRMNGIIQEITDRSLGVIVKQSFGNCPQYIQPRKHYHVHDIEAETTEISEVLSEDLSQWIMEADTFFIASGCGEKGKNPAFGMDVSHRGGLPGFVEILDKQTLRFPDYSGNNFFNTIGNLMSDPRVGLLFIHFEKGHILQITGQASIDWDSEEIGQIAGAQRLVTIKIDRMVARFNALSLRWDQKHKTEQANLLITDKIQESEDVTSFYLRNPSKTSLIEFKAGQHLPVALKDPVTRNWIKRTYSLSNAPNAHTYRISVKREDQGIMSRLLHDHFEKGMQISVQNPAGDFVLQDNQTPIVLISAGVGITPMISMLEDSLNRHPTRPIHFLHAARNSQHHPFKQRIAQFTEKYPSLSTRIAYSKPLPTDKNGIDFNIVGRLSTAELRDLPHEIGHFYICGPQDFMGTIITFLENEGVSNERIYTEAFGITHKD